VQSFWPRTRRMDCWSLRISVPDWGPWSNPLLRGRPDQAEHALLAYASALGRLHADTAGNIAEHDRVLRAGFPAVRRRELRHGAQLEQHAVKLCERLGGLPPHDELAQIARRLDQPGIWLGLVHGDPCPDNALLREIAST
jgi:Ser/Thr protein kinase RdoA (MazF antagonist)